MMRYATCKSYVSDHTLICRKQKITKVQYSMTIYPLLFRLHSLAYLPGILDLPMYILFL